jgi:hypothetical protein
VTAFLFSINYLRLLFFMDLNEFNYKAKLQKKENESFFRRLKNKPPKNIDELIGPQSHILKVESEKLGK